MEESRTIFSFPRGARAGSCLHLIFERLDFTGRDRSGLETLVARTLLEHGFEVEWTGVVAEMVERVIATPLDGRGLRLGQVAPGRRLNEMEFYYPLAGINAEGLRQILMAHGPWPGPFGERIETLDFNPVRGFMKGFIDLVFEADGRFYLVDYKSNWLGASAEAYGQEAVTAAMGRDSYYLQYLIYAVALHRYLGSRLPDYDYERHFGGVFYLFLRGMDPRLGPDYGVFRDRPSRQLVEALDGYMG
jgi:exodeoxyribonuclease V beta subunit